MELSPGSVIVADGETDSHSTRNLTDVDSPEVEADQDQEEDEEDIKREVMPDKDQNQMFM